MPRKYEHWDEKVLTTGGVAHILRKVSGKILLAVGIIRIIGKEPLRLWKEYDGDGIILRGMMPAVSVEQDGYFTSEDYRKFLKMLEDIVVIFERIEAVHNVLVGMAKSITEIRAELAGIEEHLTKLDNEIEEINATLDRIEERISDISKLIDEAEDTINKLKEEADDCLQDVKASGSGCLTLNASVSDQKATITGSVSDATETEAGMMTQQDKLWLDELWKKYQDGEFGCDCGNITYGDPKVSLSYGKAGAEDESLKPSYSYYQIRTDNDGNETRITDGGDLVFTIADKGEGVSINDTTGELTFPKNEDTSEKTLGTVTLSVTMSGNTGYSDPQTVVQEGAEEPEPPGPEPEVTGYTNPRNASLSYGTVPVEGVTADDNFLPSYQVDLTENWSDGTTKTVTVLSSDDDKKGLEFSFSIEPDGREGVDIVESTGALIVPSAEEIVGEGYYGVGTVTMTATLGSDTATAKCDVGQALNTVQEVTTATIEINEFKYDEVPTEGADSIYPHLTFTVTETITYTDDRKPVVTETTYSTDNGDDMSAFNIVYRSGDFSNFDTSTGRIMDIPATEETGEEAVAIGEVRVDIDIASYASASATTKVYQGVGEVPEPDRYSDIKITLIYNGGEDLPNGRGDYEPTLHFEQYVLNLDGSVKETITGYMTPEGNDIPDGAEITFTMNPSGEGENDAFVDGESGVLSVTNNLDPYRIYLGKVRVTIKMNGVESTGESNEIWWAAYEGGGEGGGEGSTGWGYPDVRLTLDALGWEAGSMIEVKPEIRQYRYEDGEIVETKTDGFDVEYDLVTDYDVEFEYPYDEMFVHEENTSAQSRVLGTLNVQVTGEDGKQSDLTVDVVQEGQTTTYDPDNNPTASKYGVEVKSVNGAFVTYVDLHASRIDVDFEGKETVLDEDVVIMRIGEDSDTSNITGGFTASGNYISGIKCGTYKPTYMEIMVRNMYDYTVEMTCTAGNFQSQCPYDGDVSSPSDIPSTQYTDELTNIEVGNDGPNALINIINLSWSN